MDKIWAAAAALIAIIAGVFGAKIGRRGAEKKVRDIAEAAGARLDEKRRDDKQDKLDAIDSRPDGGNADWVEDQLRGRARTGGRVEKEPEG